MWTEQSGSEGGTAFGGGVIDDSSDLSTWTTTFGEIPSTPPNDTGDAPGVPADSNDHLLAFGHFGEEAGRHSAPPKRVADRGDTKPPLKASANSSKTTANAYIKVVVNDESFDSKEWKGKGNVSYPLPAEFRGQRIGGQWQWDNDDGRLTRVLANEHTPSSGTYVESWAASVFKKPVLIRVFVQRIEDVTIDSNAKDGDRAPGHSKDERDAGDGSSNKKSPDGRGPGEKKGTGSDEWSNKPEEGTGSGGQRGQKDGNAGEQKNGSKLGKPGGKSGGRDGGTGDGEEDISLDDGPTWEDDIWVMEFEDEIGANEPDGTPDGTEGGKQKDGHGKVGGNPKGTGKDGSPNGNGPDGEKGKPNGEGEGSETVGKERGSQEGSKDGKKDGDAGGMVGGTGEKGSDGVPMGGPLGLFAVPASLKGLVDLALIISNGDILGFGAKLFAKGLGKIASKVAARKAVARAAKVEAAKETKKAIAKIKADPKKANQWNKMKKADRDAAQRVIYWENQRKIVAEYNRLAKEEVKAAKRALSKKKPKKPSDAAEWEKDRAVWTKREKNATLADEATRVEPVAGRLPQNHAYAGESFPKRELPRKYRDAGLKIDDRGYPEFKPHSYKATNKRTKSAEVVEIQIEMTGSYKADFKIANQKAKEKYGLARQPEGHTWHHLEDGKTMILVPTDLHDAVKHTGGVAHWKHAHGVNYAD